MTFILDCETGESTIDSLCEGFSCTKEALHNILLSIDIDAIYEKQWEQIDIPSEQYLYNYVTDKAGKHKALSDVYWFHLTRTTKDNMFQDGILPLGKSLSLVWDMMLSLTDNNEVNKNLTLMKNHGVANDLYDLKTPDPLHWGPYAILVKDVGHHSNKLFQHDYLGMPEIVEDICNGYEKQFGDSILEYYEKHLVPKIVKFRSNKHLGVGYLEAAIYHAYTSVRGAPPSGGSVACFDGKGKEIPHTDIISVTVAHTDESPNLMPK